jgi:hypothetical protein
MKALTVAAVVTGVALIGLGGFMAVTNPTEPAYEEYAVEKLSGYAKENACEKVSFLADRCRSLIDSRESEIQQVIAENTNRQDFVLFSIYTTKLSTQALLPAQLQGVAPALTYEFETVGVMQSFYTYKAKRK